MNFKVNKETLSSPEKICDFTQEQSVELDYVLPDYYPEIFRIVKCHAEPKITSCAVSGDRITYELTVCLKIIYCGEGSSIPEAIDQKLTYSRTVALDSEAASPSVYIKAAADHFVCRAVNRRRIDIRGAVTIRITAIGEKETEIVSDAFGGNIQLKKTGCICPSGIIKTQKRVTVSDEFELGSDMPSIGTILRTSAEIVSTDKKMISNKVAAKGELKIFLLYTPSVESDEPVYSMQFSLPYSQLCELEGMDDSYDCLVSSEVISCDMRPVSSGDGDSRSIECEVLMLISCTAVKMSAMKIVCDEYSTSHISSHTAVPVKIRREAVPIDSTVIVKGMCENKDSPISVVYDAWCDTDKLFAEITDKKLYITGTSGLYVMGKAENGDFIICESDVAVNEPIPAGNSEISENAEVKLDFSVISCSYTISSDNTAEIKAEIAVRGWITDCDTIDAITEISVDETSPRENEAEYALRMYFAESGEDLWDISKKYGASVSRVTEENELQGNEITENVMLLIPME